MEKNKIQNKGRIKQGVIFFLLSIFLVSMGLLIGRYKIPDVSCTKYKEKIILLNEKIESLNNINDKKEKAVKYDSLQIKSIQESEWFTTKQMNYGKIEDTIIQNKIKSKFTNFEETVFNITLIETDSSVHSNIQKKGSELFNFLKINPKCNFKFSLTPSIEIDSANKIKSKKIDIKLTEITE